MKNAQKSPAAASPLSPSRNLLAFSPRQPIRILLLIQCFPAGRRGAVCEPCESLGQVASGSFSWDWRRGVQRVQAR